MYSFLPTPTKRSASAACQASETGFCFRKTSFMNSRFASVRLTQLPSAARKIACSCIPASCYIVRHLSKEVKLLDLLTMII